MKKKPKTALRWVIESLGGKRLDKTYYETVEQADMFANKIPCLINKIWVTESSWK